MKTFNTNLIAALMIGSLGLAGSAFACGGGGNGGGHGGWNGGWNGGNNNRNNQTCNNNGGYNNGGGYENYGQAYEPFHSSYICQPGDSFYTVSLKEYGTSNNLKYIASYNRMATNAALVPGQRLMLPSISANGRLTASRAPAAEIWRPRTSSSLATNMRPDSPQSPRTGTDQRPHGQHPPARRREARQRRRCGPSADQRCGNASRSGRMVGGLNKDSPAEARRRPKPPRPSWKWSVPTAPWPRPTQSR